MTPVSSIRSVCIGIVLVLGLSACGGGSSGALGSAAPMTGVTPAPVPVESTNKVLLSPGLKIGDSFWSNVVPTTGPTSPDVDGVICAANEDYHIHAHLTIIRNGEVLAVPSGIGLTGCARELHTHDESGIIHVETSAFKNFTLGQFFSVWGQPLSRSNVAGITGLNVSVYVNSGLGLTEYTNNIGSIPITQHASIVIVTGSALTVVPAFAWPASL